MRNRKEGKLKEKTNKTKVLKKIKGKNFTNTRKGVFYVKKKNVKKAE